MYAIADTHAVIWYLLADSRLSEKARVAFDEASRLGEPIGLPAICLVEMIYLTEKNRIPQELLVKLRQELDTEDSPFVVVPLDEQIAMRVSDIERAVVPELPDRVITATAFHLGVPLITRDHKIHASGIKTIW